MREIKFRAWDRIEEMFRVARLDMADVSLYKTLINGKAYDYWNDAMLMQYAGLKDSNGKDIYEGDIIKHKLGSKKTVWFKNGAFVISHENSNVYLLYDLVIEDDCLTDWEVIGNIYED